MSDWVKYSRTSVTRNSRETICFSSSRGFWEKEKFELSGRNSKKIRVVEVLLFEQMYEKVRTKGPELTVLHRTNLRSLPWFYRKICRSKIGRNMKVQSYIRRIYCMNSNSRGPTLTLFEFQRFELHFSVFFSSSSRGFSSSKSFFVYILFMEGQRGMKKKLESSRGFRDNGV